MMSAERWFVTAQLQREIASWVTAHRQSLIIFRCLRQLKKRAYVAQLERVVRVGFESGFWWGLGTIPKEPYTSSFYLPKDLEWLCSLPIHHSKTTTFTCHSRAVSTRLYPLYRQDGKEGYWQIGLKEKRRSGRSCSWARYMAADLLALMFIKLYLRDSLTHGAHPWLYQCSSVGTRVHQLSTALL